jgi:hypothetical protein
MVAAANRFLSKLFLLSKSNLGRHLLHSGTIRKTHVAMASAATATWLANGCNSRNKPMAMMLASCESIPSSFNPFTPETTTTSTSGSPETGQTNRATYEAPLGRSPENSVPTNY